jgi:hypothetical protein
MSQVAKPSECECGSSESLRRDGSLWCARCGVQLEEEPQIVDNRVPGVGNDPDTGASYGPKNTLAFGDNLGNVAVDSKGRKKALLNVLKQSGRDNLVLRTIMVRNECMLAEEDPITRRLKEYLSVFSKRFGFDQHVILSNSLGNNAKWVGALLTATKNGKHSKELAKGIFAINVFKIVGPEKAEEVIRVLKVKRLFMQKAQNLIHLDKLVL